MYNAQPGTNQVVHVKIEDINIPFLHLVGLMLKVSIAAIPAALIMFLVGLVLSALATGAFATVAAMITALLRR
jgi:hypothetical protein